MYFGNVVLPKGPIDPNSIVPITSSTALSGSSYGKTLVIGAPGTFTVTLMPLVLSAKGNTFTLINDSTGTTTVNTSGSDVIRVLGTNATSFTLGPGDTVSVENNGATWVITANAITKANINSPSFTGNPLAPTPAQFDSSTSIPNTSFLKRALGSLSGVNQLAGTLTLTATYVGKMIELSGGGYTITLPPANIDSNGGAVISFHNIGTGTVTLSRQGADSIYQGDVNGVGGRTSIALKPGDTVTMVGNGAIWYTIAGSAALVESGVMRSSLVTGGWQKLPSGLILQWGSGGYNATAVTFPIAFPSACLQIIIGATNYSAGNAQYQRVAALAAYSPTLTGFTAGNADGTIVLGGSWIALGF